MRERDTWMCMIEIPLKICTKHEIRFFKIFPIDIIDLVFGGENIQGSGVESWSRTTLEIRSLPAEKE